MELALQYFFALLNIYVVLQNVKDATCRFIRFKAALV